MSSANHRISRTTPTLVEQTLAGHGVWNAVLFLLDTHRLRRSDYEAWRLGDTPCLEDAMIGNRQRILAMLDAARMHAEQMGLATVPMIWTGWGHQAGTPLRLFHDDHANVRFQIQLTPKEDRPQLDLFMDAPKTILLNRLRRALLDRSPERDTLFDDALDEMPNEAALARLDAIRTAMKRRTIDDSPAWFKYLDEVIAPAVMEEFNHQVMDIMAPLWRVSAVTLQDSPFDPELPELHASEAWLRAQAWESCVASVECVPDWHRHACLHERRIIAITAMGSYVEARQAWAAFCWLCPEDAVAALDRADLHICGLHRLWQQFSSAEPAQPVEDFPALMRLYGMHVFQESTSLPDMRHNRGWQHDQLLANLLIHEKKGHTNVELRQRLKAASPWLLRAYMAGIGRKSVGL